MGILLFILFYCLLRFEFNCWIFSESSESFLQVVNNKRTIFKQSVTVGIWKFCVLRNLSDEFINFRF